MTPGSAGVTAITWQTFPSEKLEIADQLSPALVVFQMFSNPAYSVRQSIGLMTNGAAGQAERSFPVISVSVKPCPKAEPAHPFVLFRKLLGWRIAYTVASSMGSTIACPTSPYIRCSQELFSKRFRPLSCSPT